MATDAHATPRGPVQLFATDLDGTLLGHPDACGRFSDAWHATASGNRPLLVYNTGRTAADTLGLVHARQLPSPDYVIGSVGTQLHDAAGTLGAEFQAQFGAGWDHAEVEAIVRSTPGPKPQPREFNHHYKSSWYWTQARGDEIEALKTRLTRAGIQAHVDYSCRTFLDVVPAAAGKGRALAWLCRRLEIPLESVLVAGDSGNDSSMFRLPGVRGIVVENALPELLAVAVPLRMFVARTAMADGVLEGLHHFGVVSPENVRDERALPVWR